MGIHWKCHRQEVPQNKKKNVYLIPPQRGGHIAFASVVSLFVCPGRHQLRSEVSVSVEFHIMRLTFVYSVIVGKFCIMGLKNWYCGVKKIKRIIL